MSTTEPPPREPSPPAVSRDTRIEQLLLAGLDRYFAGEFEHAIQVWSRVFFLDRGHARARAYIERARGALAERQREAEARAYRAETSRGPHAEASSMASPMASPIVSPIVSAAQHVDGLRDTPTLVRRDFPGTSGAPAVALATMAEDDLAVTIEAVAVESGPALDRSSRTAAKPWLRIVAQTLLVVLAAALLFTAGYVVAARDDLAQWWAGTSPPEPPPAAGSPQVPGSAGSIRSHGSASR